MTATDWLKLCREATQKKPDATLEEHKAILASLIAKLPPPQYARGQGCAYIGGFPTHQLKAKNT